MQRGPVWQAPAEHFPNRLGAGPAESLPCRGRLLALLVLLALLPRAAFALYWNQLWTDSVTFHNASLALAHGDLREGFRELGLNIYPLILWGLRATGLPWEQTAEWWSVALASAAVLPLFGWVRRQFDDRVATVACLLYAVHGKLIAMSCLVIRDPTFWFLFLLTLYLMWRAISELRWRYFLLGGLALMLSAHLRTEGWLLVLPLALWSLCRWPSAAGARRRLILGAAVCLAIAPVCVTTLNLTVLRSAPQWMLLRQEHIDILFEWIDGRAPPEAAQPLAHAPAAPAAEERADFDTIVTLPSMSPLVKMRKLAVQLIKAYTYVLGVLAIIGALAFIRVFLRGEHLALLAVVLALLAAIWIRSADYRNDPRYFVPIVLVSFGWMALGFLATTEAIFRALGGHAWTRRRQTALLVVLALAVVVPSACEVKLSWGRYMVTHAELGRWIRAEYGPGRRFAANTVDLRLVQYYSEGEVTGHFRSLPDQPLPPAITARPELILIWFEDDDRGFTDFADRIEAEYEGQYLRVPADRVPNHWIVLARRDLAVSDVE
jgi:hypothetical protein